MIIVDYRSLIHTNCYGEKKMKYIKRHISLVVSFIAAITIFITSYFWDPFNFNTFSTLLGFLLSVITLLLGQIIDVQIEVDKTSDNTEIVCETMRDSLHITKLGTPKKAWKYIMERLPEFDYVQNTSFNFGEEIEKTQYRLYNDESYLKPAKTIAEHVNKGLQWHDIGDESASKRFEEIDAAVSKKTNGEYLYKLITQSEPQIGFILLTYKDGTKEALFNWDFREIPQDPTVLLSRDKDVFDMFAAQYTGLWREGSIPYDKTATRSTSKK